jgi:hypothetical protein
MVHLLREDLRTMIHVSNSLKSINQQKMNRMAHLFHEEIPNSGFRASRPIMKMENPPHVLFVSKPNHKLFVDHLTIKKSSKKKSWVMTVRKERDRIFWSLGLPAWGKPRRLR